MSGRGTKAAHARRKPAAPSGLAEAERIAQIGYWDLDLERNALVWSDEIYRIFEIDPARFHASYEAFLDAIHPEDREYVNDAYTTSLRTRVPYNIVHRLLMKDGRIKYVRERCETSYDAAGRPLRSIGTVQDITEQRLTFEALRASEVLLRTKFEEAEERARKLAQAERIANVGSWEADLAANRLTYSDEAMRIHGLTAGTFDCTVTGAIALAHPEDRLRLTAAINATLYEGKPLDVEYRIVRPDGSERFVRVQDEVVRDAGGRPVRAFGITQDLTERMREEAVLRRTVDELNEAQRVAHVGSWRLDTATGEVVWTEEIYRMFRLDPALPPPPYDEHRRLFVPESWDRLSAALPRTRDEGVPYELELEMVRADGSRGWMLARGEALQDMSGRFVGVRGTAQDITERKRAEKDLRRFRLAIDSTEDSIYLTDPVTMRFVDVNAAACQRLGYTREQLLGMGPHDAIGAKRSDIEREFQQVIAAGSGGIRFERPFVTSDGRHGTTELYRKAFRSEADGELLVVSVGRDITRRKEAEARIARLNRSYAVLSGINAAIVRVRDSVELFEEACHILVEKGQLALAYVCVVDPKDQRLNLVASAGIDAASFLESAKARMSLRDGAPEGYGPPALAVRALHPIVANDVASDSRIQRREEHARRGIRSIAALPVLVSGKAVAVLGLHSSDAEFFDDDQMRLFTELAGDIGFALDHIGKSNTLDYLAFYDQATGLANRRLFLDRLTQAVHVAGQTGDKMAVVILDVERLATVNESLGRQSGDELVKQLANRLYGSTGQNEVGRVSANNFAVVFRSVKGKSEAMRRIEKLWQDCFGMPFRLADSEIRSSARGGVAMFPDCADAEALLQGAESALRIVKRTGERYAFYAREITQKTAEDLSLENQLRQGLEREEFLLHYQPKVDVLSGAIVGVEALIRWQSPTLGLVPPGRFIPLMEQTGIILEAGKWALSRAVLDHKRWAGLGLQVPRVAVNVSAVQLRKKDFLATLEKALAGGGVPPGIDLEITESIVMEDLQGNIEKLRAVRGLGVGIAIDDFGTGYSSLGYLARLPVDALKIDRSFIGTMLSDVSTMTVVQMIISLAHSLRLKVIAEGVEDQEQARILRLLRCDEIQGYLFSKPVPFDAMTRMLAERPFLAQDA